MYVKEYPTMHYLGIQKNQTQWINHIFLTHDFCIKLYSGPVVDIPNYSYTAMWKCAQLVQKETQIKDVDKRQDHLPSHECSWQHVTLKIGVWINLRALTFHILAILIISRIQRLMYLFVSVSSFFSSVNEAMINLIKNTMSSQNSQTWRKKSTAVGHQGK